MNDNSLTRAKKTKMSETLNEIRVKVGKKNLTNNCNGKGCRVYLDDVPSDRVIVNVDLVFDEQRITGKYCDRILFYLCPTENRLVVVLIEHKSGTFDSAKDLADQLRGGASYARKVIPTNAITTCVPVLFHGSGTHKVQHNKLRREKISFQGNQYPISKTKCNVERNLSTVLKQMNVLT